MNCDELKEFPCPNAADDAVCNEDCPVLLLCRYPPVYRAHIKLRADMRKLRAAVLGGLPPEVAAYVYRNVTTLYAERGNAEAERRFNALADVVAKL